jgi:hypothetical protein
MRPLERGTSVQEIWPGAFGERGRRVVVDGCDRLIQGLGDVVRFSSRARRGKQPRAAEERPLIRKVARLLFSAPAGTAQLGRLAKRWHATGMRLDFGYKGLTAKTGFVVKGGNAWHFVRLPGKTCVLPQYQETVPDDPRRRGATADRGAVLALYPLRWARRPTVRKAGRVRSGHYPRTVSEACGERTAR